MSQLGTAIQETIEEIFPPVPERKRTLPQPSVGILRLQGEVANTQTADKEKKRELGKALNKSRYDDKAARLEEKLEKMQAAYDAREVRVSWTKKIGAKKFSSIQPKRLVQKDASGVVYTDREFNSTEEMLEEWTSKMKARFAPRAGKENRKSETLDSADTIPDPSSRN